MDFKNLSREPAPSNYRANVQILVKQYAKGLVHGFQKDAIQNAMGARNSDDFAGWKCQIDIVKTEKGTFLTVEDFGTLGLTGKNLTVSEIRELTNAGKLKDETMRLARIESVYNSGNNNYGGGLFGIGKMMYSAASDEDVCTYYFESVSSVPGEGYRSNSNMCGEVLTGGALENEVGREYIETMTGLKPIDHVGTRFIICSPREELLTAIRDGTMLNYAEETWWRIIDYWPTDCGIYINGIRLEKPEEYLANENVENSDMGGDDRVDSDHRIKKYGFAILKKEIKDENLRGFYFYRAGMKICEISPEFVPELIQGRFYGFVELDKKWAYEMSQIEDQTHYGLQPGKWKSTTYTLLKQYVQNRIKKALVDWNYIKIGNEDERLKNGIEDQIKKEIEELFHDAGYEPLGRGDDQDNVVLRLNRVAFPHPDEGRTVYDGDRIEIDFTVKNVSSNSSFFNVVVNNDCEDLKVSKEIQRFEIEAKTGLSFSGHYSFEIRPDESEKNLKNTLEILVIAKGQKTPVAKRKIVFYYSTPTVKDKQNDFEFSISHRVFPRIGSRRVDSDESIGDVTYKATNNTNLDLQAELIVSAHNVNDRHNLIERVHEEKIELKPFEEVLSTPFDLLFSENVYGKKMKKGPIEIRARLSVSGKQACYENQESLGQDIFTVYFNYDTKNGIFDSFGFHCDRVSDRPERSWVENEGNKKTIVVNTGFPEYDSLPDEKCQDDYILKEGIAQYLLLYVEENRTENLGMTGTEQEQREPYTVAKCLKQSIDKLWWKKCQK